jgi:hypothetical protein
VQGVKPPPPTPPPPPPTRIQPAFEPVLGTLMRPPNS